MAEQVKVRVSTLEMAERSAVAEREAPGHVKALYEYHDTIEQADSIVGRINEATWLQGHNFSLKEVADLAKREKTGLQRSFTIAKARNEGMAAPFVVPVGAFGTDTDYDMLIEAQAERYPSWDSAIKAIATKETSERFLARYVKAVRDSAKDPVALSTKGHKILVALYNAIKTVETKGRPKLGVPPITNIRDLMLSCLSGTVPEAHKIVFGPFPEPDEGELTEAEEAINASLVEEEEEVKV